MGYNSNIAWTHHTMNPWLGCVEVSAGCANCYAREFAKNRMGLDVWGDGHKRKKTKTPWANVVKWDTEATRLGERYRVFCASLCDVFEDNPELVEHRAQLWKTIKLCKSLDWLLLTKRPENIVDMLPPDWGDGYGNVWLGTTIEDDRVIDRADILREIPAVVRFISYEPAIGPLDDLDLTGLDWIIYGGESGPKRRAEGIDGDPKAWARTMRDKCKEAGVAFFHKQSSSLKSGAGIKLDGEIVQQFPKPRGETPKAEVPEPEPPPEPQTELF